MVGSVYTDVHCKEDRAQGTFNLQRERESGDEPLLQLTHSHVVGIKSRESLLIGEIGLESDGHEGARGEDHFLARGMLSVRGLPAAEDCQQLVFSFYLWGQSKKAQDEQLPKLASLLVSSRKEEGVDQE